MVRSSAFLKFLGFCQTATVVPSLASTSATIATTGTVLALSGPAGWCVAAGIAALSAAVVLDKRKQDSKARELQVTLEQYVSKQGLQNRALEDVLIHALDDPDLEDLLPPGIGREPLAAMLAILKAKGDEQKRLLEENSALVEAVEAAIGERHEEVMAAINQVAGGVETIDDRTAEMQAEWRAGRVSSPTIPEGVTNNLHAALVRRNPRFVGRGELLRDLHTMLTAGTNASLSHALSADGGVGKTEIAAAYATSERYAPSWEGIWWLDASNDGFDSSLLSLLRELGFVAGGDGDAQRITREQAQQEIVRRLGDGRHLVVLDNVDSTDTITGFPFRDATTLLVTTRLSAIPGEIAETVRVDNLGPEDAARLLVSGRPDLQDSGTGLPLPEHRDTIEAIAAEVGHLALALAITARAFERRTGQTPERMLARIREAVRAGWVRPFSEIGEGVESRNYRKGVAASLLLHLPELEESVPLSGQLLLLASQCHAERIPVSLLASCVDADEDADAVERALLALQDRSMIVFEEGAGVDGSGLVSLHRLSQSACRARAGADLSAQAHAEIVEALIGVFDDPSHPDRWPAQREAEPHALAAIGDDGRGSDSEPMARVLNQVAFVQTTLGRAAEAEPIFQQALDMRRRLFEGDHPDVAQSLNSLAFVRQALGRADEAEPIYQEALDMARRLYDGDHPNIATGLNNLASVKESLGRADEAEPIYQEALDMVRRLYDGDHPNIATSLNGVAFVKQALGRADEAEPLFQQALDMDRRLFGGDHPNLVIRLNNLAQVRISLGRLREALGPATEAAEMARRCLPEGHEYRTGSESNLALLLQELEGDS
ncbi:MAG: tetratricopeptide repeat protein [Planctomycetota bacterium]